MGSTTTNGSIGTAVVRNSSIAAIVQNWSIPEQFRDQAIKGVSLLVLAATEGTYLAQGFVFDVTTTVSLTTLIVAARKISPSTDADPSVAVLYVTINSNALVKQLYSQVSYRHCWICPKCLWVRKCCCENRIRDVERGHSPEELNIVKQKMMADQFIWFNEHNTSFSESRVHFKRSLSNENNDYRMDLTAAIEKYMSRPAVKTEILRSYNDSILNVLQSNMTSIQSTSELLKMTKVASNNLNAVLTALANDFGFEKIDLNAQQLASPRFSYENLFTSSIGSGTNQLAIRYIWIILQKDNNAAYTIHFTYSNITSQILIKTLLSNATSTQENEKQIKILRTSILGDNGQFLQEEFSSYITPWQRKTTIIALNILRFIGASKMIPQTRYRMLSLFNPELISPGNASNRPQSRSITAKIMALSKAVSAVTSTFKDIVQTFKSSSSVTISRITRFGFTYFNQKSTVLKALDIPASRADEFIRALALDYNLPSKGSFMLGLTYSDDFTWDSIQYLYSPSMNGSYRSLTLFKNGDSVKNTASFFIVDIDVNWDLAPDLLIITKTKSILGGLWSSTKQSIQEVPHILTLDEAMKLQQFFMVIAMGNLANTFGMNTTYPALS